MQDLPMFTTEHGVASLVLREIPYKATAYITIQDTQQPRELLTDCIEFCKAVGAEKIYAKGHEFLQEYPLHTAVLQMRCPKANLQKTDCIAKPVTDETIEKWRSIYNEKMLPIPNASTMTRDDGEKLVKRGVGYFIYRDDSLLGIGIAHDDTIEAIAAVKQGAGTDVMLALCDLLPSNQVILEVASANLPARKLYQKLGFLEISEISRWYDVLTRKNT